MPSENKQAGGKLNGEILLDSPFAKKIGFTSDKFIGSYLWQMDKYIIISMIIALEQRKGYFTEMVKKIEGLGYKIKVPTPFPIMETWLKKNGYKPTIENDKDFGDVVEVWTKGAK